MSATAAPAPRSGEFFAPLPLGALALLVVNDVWLKPAFHSAVTGKLSDIAICFFMPLLLSELLGILCGWPPRRRLIAGAIVTAALFTALEIVPPFTRLALDWLEHVGPHLGIHGRFRMTSDWTDLACVPVAAVAVAYGRARLATIVSDAALGPGRTQKKRPAM
jgi:hypothetical protein